MFGRRVERTHVADRPVDEEVVEQRSGQVVETPSGRVVRTTPYQRVDAPPAAAAYDQIHATSYDPYANRRRTSWKLVQLIWLLFGIVEGILAIRFILKLLGANEAAGFASFIYSA